MEPIEKDKPSSFLFLLMTATYFVTYFGLRFGLNRLLAGSGMSWEGYYSGVLILVSLLPVFALRNWGKGRM